MVQAKKVRYCKIFLLAWRVVLGIVRVREGAEISTLLRDLTRDARRVKRVTCHYGNELDELIPFRLICNTAIIVGATFGDIPWAMGGIKRLLLILSQ